MHSDHGERIRAGVDWDSRGELRELQAIPRRLRSSRVQDVTGQLVFDADAGVIAENGDGLVRDRLKLGGSEPARGLDDHPAHQSEFGRTCAILESAAACFVVGDARAPIQIAARSASANAGHSSVRRARPSPSVANSSLPTGVGGIPSRHIRA
jgi:hypothetical protein